MRRAWVSSPFSVLKVSIVQLEIEVRICTKDNEKSSHGCDHGAASGGLERQKHGWHQKDTANSWQSPHPNVWHIWLKIILSNLLEVEVSVEATEPSSKGDEELSKWWVTSMKNLPLMYLDAKPPKLESVC